jgi:hypothetical protein
MPKDKKRESNRKDIWLTEYDAERVQAIAQHMHNQGIEPNRQEYSLSEIVRYAIEQVYENSVKNGEPA